MLDKLEKLEYTVDRDSRLVNNVSFSDVRDKLCVACGPDTTVEDMPLGHKTRIDEARAKYANSKRSGKKSRTSGNQVTGTTHQMTWTAPITLTMPNGSTAQPPALPPFVAPAATTAFSIFADVDADAPPTDEAAAMFESLFEPVVLDGLAAPNIHDAMEELNAEEMLGEFLSHAE